MDLDQLVDILNSENEEDIVFGIQIAESLNLINLKRVKLKSELLNSKKWIGDHSHFPFMYRRFQSRNLFLWI